MRERRTAIGLSLFLSGILALSPGVVAAQSDNQDQPPPKPQDQSPSDQPKPSHGDDRTDDRGGGRGGVGVGVGVDVTSLFGHHGGRRTQPLTLYRVELPADPAGEDYRATDRMFATLRFHGRGLVGYLNLSVDGVWVVQNVPVIAMRDGATESQWFGFSLHGPHQRGGDSIGYDVRSDVRVTPPRETMRVTIAPKRFFFCGEGGDDPNGGGGGGGLVGGKVIGKAHVHQGAFPNQKSEINQCVSVAFSNSLQWMNSTHNLRLDADKISPAGLDKIVGRKPGKPVDYDTATQKKSAAFAKSIDTYSVEPGKIPSIGDAIDKQCDVEMFTSPKDGGVGHAVAVTGISRIQTEKNGIKWQINIVEDAKQGPANATDHNPVSETVTYPWDASQIKGGAGVDGKVISGFVVECKKGTDVSF